MTTLIARPPVTRLALDLTRRCNLQCTHCYNDSSPLGGHGTMQLDDWHRVVTEAHAYGVTRLQMIGGEPTLHPGLADLTGHAVADGMQVEIYTNLVHVPPATWRLFEQPGVSVATSYYSADPATHDTVTRRPSHNKTRANIAEAVVRGVDIRVGIVATSGPDHATGAAHDLATLGVLRFGVDQVRPFGRGRVPAQHRLNDTGGLCGRCGVHGAAVGPTGDVSPCVMSTWIVVGNVHDTTLSDLLGAVTPPVVSDTDDSGGSGGCDPGCECQPDAYPCQPDAD